MAKNKISIKVLEEVAEAYRNASPERRKRAEQAIAAALMSKEEVVRAFRNIIERASAYAAEQGLTSKKLDELLRENDGN